MAVTLEKSYLYLKKIIKENDTNVIAESTGPESLSVVSRLENINQEIEEKEAELKEAGINSQEDLDKMKEDIEIRYNSLVEKIETYRNAIN